jgi:hypothetical protein
MADPFAADYPVKSAVASLCDIVSELAICSAQQPDAPVSKGWAFTAVKTLAAHTRQMDFVPNLTEGSIPSWEEEL